MRQLPVSSKQLVMILMLAMSVCCCGCNGFRAAATEAQKENAWLHGQVCAMAAETAVDENVSAQLCGLTNLAYQQSAAFVTDYGLPQSPSTAGDVETLLAEGAAVAQTAQIDAAQKPDMWTLADSAMELGVALAGLVGGVYGVRVAGFLKTAREKSAALKEIVVGNELFKQLYPEQSDRFKEAQQKQSPATKKIVTELKAGS